MEKYNLMGIIPPIVTPFNENEDLDETTLRKEIRYMMDAGVHGISFGGSTGEGAVLTDEELARGIQIIQEENKKHLPVLCGIIRNSTREAVKAGWAAKKAGADILMVTPTYYYGTCENGNYDFYKVLSDEIGLPIIVYNVIKNNPISPHAMKRLGEIERIIGIKQSIGGIHSLTDMIYTCGDKTLVFAAQDDLLFAAYLLGAVGAISAILAVFPKLCVEQWEAIKNGNIEKARKIHYRILPVWRKIEGIAFPGKIKAVLKLLGRDVGNARKPILEASHSEMEELKKALLQSGFIK